MSKLRLLAALAFVTSTSPLPAQTQAAGAASSASPGTRVGPEHGTVIVVGGGSMPPEVTSAFIAAAGGPDALIVDVPTAGTATSYAAGAPGALLWARAGARHVVVLHTTDPKVADSDSLAALVAKAGGVWFEGGRQYRLVDAYAATRTERAFHDVLARGGVVGGSSAGASILGDFLVRGAPSNNNLIMDDPSHRKGFAFLRGVAIDQHVVARERLADLADSIMPKYPSLLGMSEDEGTAWVVRGDTAKIIGYNKAFAYGGAERDAGKPFLTLHPGDTYDLARRTLVRRASAGSPLTEAFVDSLFASYASGAPHRAEVLVARGGAVLVDKSYGIPDQPKYMPTTAVPQFALGGMSDAFRALCSGMRAAGLRPNRREASGAVGDTTLACLPAVIVPFLGMHRTAVHDDGQVWSDVDELYRLSVGLDEVPTFAGIGAAAFAAAGGRRAAMVRRTADRATAIVITDDDAADARGIAQRLLDRLGTRRSN